MAHKTKETIAVVGAGAWGTTMSILLSKKAEEVLLWVYEDHLAETIRSSQENRTFLPGVSLPKNIKPITLFKDIRSAKIIFIAVPAEHFRAITKQIAPFISKGALLVSLTKGIEFETAKRMSEILKEETKSKNIAIISGPNLSKEISRGMPAATVIASKNIQIAKKLQALLNSENYRVYTTTDVVGVEIGGTLKNAIAIAAGISDGLELGGNAKAALVVRGMEEIKRLGLAMGGKPATFSGLSGMGDLITTCSSNLSRNHQVGYKLARGEKWETINKEMVQVAEGVNTSKTAKKLAKKYKVELPIIREVYNIIFAGKSPKEAIISLMSRTPKKEHLL